MTNRSVGPLSIAFFAAAATGCGVMSLEAELPEITVTQVGLKFEGVPPGLLNNGRASLSHSFEQKHDKIELPDEIDSEMDFLGLTLTARDGVEDFGFIENLRLTIKDGNEGSPTLELIDYEKPQNGSVSRVLDMRAPQPVNAVDQLKSESNTVTIDFAGTLPSRSWKADVSLTFRARAKYTYQGGGLSGL